MGQGNNITKVVGTAAGARLAKAMRSAANARPEATGAALGTVVAPPPPPEGDDSLWIELDTGQVVPQCFGPTLPAGQRVLCWWINQGHELVVLPMAPTPNQT